MKKNISNVYFWLFITVSMLSIVSGVLRDRTIEIQNDSIRLSDEIIDIQSKMIDSLMITRAEFDEAVKRLNEKK